MALGGARHADGHRHGLGAHLLSWKTASYAVMHLAVAIAVAYALTLDWRKALAIGLIEPIVQTFAFVLHDRFWSRRAASVGTGTGTGTGEAVAQSG